MEIYLIQHAHAKVNEEDPQRPLSKRGESDITRVAEYTGKQGITIDRIYHSGKLRAKQTAEILAKYLQKKGIVVSKKGLHPGDEIIPIKEWLEKVAGEGVQSLAIVGHLPFLDRLASFLVAGGEEAHVVAFQNSGIVKLIPESSGNGYSIEWILTPNLV